MTDADLLIAAKAASAVLGTPVAVLRAAKKESDRKNFRAKHHLVRQLILADPGAFTVDSEARGVVGLTHRSGFRLHLPSRVVPRPPLLLRPLRRATIARGVLA